MAQLYVEEIINIHSEIQRRFNITQGIKNLGLLESIAQRPNFNPYTHIPFPNIYSKCACIVEGIIKWHPFIDGNKRTALAAAIAYMHKNSYMIVLPFNAVRFSVLIAQDKKDIKQITAWVHKLSAKGGRSYDRKLFRYLIEPAKKLFNLYQIGRENEADKILSDWLAFDIYPEYKTERQETITFLMDIAAKGLNYNKPN